MRHRRVITRAARQPTSWFRQVISADGEDPDDIVGGDIFDPTTLGVLGDGEDFELTVLRIRISTIFHLTIPITTVANAEVFASGFYGVALVGTDTTLPSPGLEDAVATQTDWLSMGGFTVAGNLVLGNVAGVFTTHWDCDVKAKRKVGIGEHLVYAIEPTSMGAGSFATQSICSVLWQRSVRR